MKVFTYAPNVESDFRFIKVYRPYMYVKLPFNKFMMVKVSWYWR